MRNEITAWARTWWCRGGGAAVLFLLVVVSVFRAPRDVIFWLALAFFAAHTILASYRYRRERRVRAQATVIRHHQAHVPTPTIIFTPQPVNSLIVLHKTPQQTKKAI